jgi:glutaredoxin
MRVRGNLALAALGIAVAAAAVDAQQLYRWVDKDGRVHYSQQPPPRDSAKSVEQRKIGGSVVESAQVPFAVQQAVKNYPVTLYTSPGCKQGCVEARELLSKRGVPHREISVEDPSSIDGLQKATGDNKVPAITIGSAVQRGYEPEALNSALDTAGYPRTSAFNGKPPPPLPATPPKPPGK